MMKIFIDIIVDDKEVEMEAYIKDDVINLKGKKDGKTN